MSERPSNESRVNVLYIEGAARSGTTILARMIGAQPRFMTVGEVVLVWRFGVIGNGKCSCGRHFSDCTFWQDIANLAPGIFAIEKARRYDQFLTSAVIQSRRTPRLWTASTRRYIVNETPPDFLQDISLLYHAIQTISGAEVIVDSSKFSTYRYLLGRVPDLNITSVHLIRDPRAVAFSWQRKLLVEEEDRVDESLRFRDRSVLVAALDWLIQNFSAEVVNKIVDYSTYRLRYEDFATRPKGIIPELIEIAGGRLNSIEDLIMDLPEVHIFGNPGRFRTGSVPIGVDDEWRRQMTKKSQALVTITASPLMFRYGYEFRSRYGVGTSRVAPQQQDDVD